MQDCAVKNIDVIGRLLSEAESMLNQCNIEYTVEQTRPGRDFFPIDDSRLYVVKQVEGKSGKLRLTVAAGLRREVS